MKTAFSANSFTKTCSTVVAAARLAGPAVRSRALCWLVLLAGLPAALAQTATWIGGNSFQNYGTAANWSPAVVPLGTNYTVIVPDSSSLVFDVSSNAVIDALSFGDGSVFRLTNQHSLTVNGPAIVKGQVEAGGLNSALRAPANVTVLSANPRLLAGEGGQIVVGASSYGWDRYNASATLLSAIGAGSLVDVKNVNSMIVSYGDGGSWTYRITARTNGVVDLSGLSQITAPGQDDWLQFDIDTGGSVRLHGLRRVAGRTRFNVSLPLLELPLLENTSETYFNVSSNSTLRLPSLVSYMSANFTVGQNSKVEAPRLVALDGVSLNLSDNASFLATNLTVYKNSDIPITPGRNFQPGLLGDLYGSRVTVSGGATFRAGALSYDMPGDWRASFAFFSADGPSSALDLSAMKNLQVHGGWGGAWTYSITASSNGVVDLSGLETASGAEGTYDSEDWLAFTAQTGGNIRLDSLRQIARRTRFNILNPQFDLPALDSADSTTFNLADGSRLNAPNLTKLESCAFSFGFNSTLNAPKLDTFINTTLAMSPGVVVNAPPFTNVYASRFAVSGGTSLTVGAPSYDTYPDWRTHLTLFSSDGTGSLLNMAAMKTLQTRGGHGGGWTYSIIVNNNGLIDLSGLETVIGMDPGYGNEDWLAFTLRNGGDIRLDSLKQITRKTRFNVELPFYRLPALDTAEGTAFTLADGSRLDLPLVRSFSGCSVSLGLNSVFNAPNLTNLYGGSVALGLNSFFNAPNLFHWDSCSVSLGLNSTGNVPNLLNFQNSTLALSPGRTFIAPPFTNIYGSFLGVSGGSVLRVAAPTYDMPGDYRASPTLFSADGVGSLLDLAALKTLQVHGGWGGAWAYSITANNNGVIDLSGLETASGGENNYDYEDYLAFNIQGGGNIKLNSLRQITRRTRINLSVPDYTMPALASVDTTTFNLGDGAHLIMPNLTNMDGSAFTFGFNNTIDAPSLRNFVNGSLNLSPGRTLNAPPFTNIYASRLAVSGGSVLYVAAPAYDMWPDWRTHLTIFSADGAGSLLEAAPMKSLQVRGGHGGGWNYSVTAINGGVVDLSGLDTIIGADPAYGNEDWLSFSAATASVIKFGDASLTRRVMFSATGQSTRLEFAGLYLRPPATLNVNTRASLDLKGDFLFDNTDLNSIVVDGAFVQMDGTQPQMLEVGGKNLGPAGASAKNFGCGQLIVGSSNQTSVVRLQDALNNGQRGPSGESEALYLYGLDGQGLRLLSNSRLILGTVPVYALLGGQMRSLNNLIPVGLNSAAFDGGFLANTAGPKITNMTPAITVNPPVSSVEVTFDIAINGASFNTADVVITGPSGPITPTGVSVVSGNTYRITFAPQAANGAYTVRVGPAIDELASNLNGLDQDGNGLGGEASDVFTNSFSIDGLAPVVVNALSLQNGTRVGLTFDEPVSPAFATNSANYLINGLPPAAVVLQTNGSQVALTVGALVGETFTLNVNNLTDLFANTTNTAFTGTILPLEPRDIGSPGSDPRETGSTVTFTGTDFNSVAGGSGIWGSSDAFHFVFERRDGDFDVRAQLTRLDRTGANADGGIMVRESLAGNSRKIQATIELPQNAGTYYPGIRHTTGGSVPSPYPYLSGVDPNNAGLPHAWIRLRRTGSVFSSFRSTNGLDWIEFGRVTNDFPAAAYLGLATCADNNAAGKAITASYRDYSDITPALAAQPQSQSVASGASVAFGVAARGLPTLAYQWTFNGVPIGGATGNLLTLSGVTTQDVGDYRVIVTNPYGSVTSQIAALVVDGVGAGGFEADVSPPPYGNNAVTVSDWVRLGRLVVGLESVLSSSEFQRADCAPRTNAVLGTLPLGDGRLTVADWTQAGRYAATLDPLAPAGGPTQGSGGGGGSFVTSLSARAESNQRSVRVSNAKAVPGQSFSVFVHLQGLGDENAVGFSLNFDATRLACQRASLGDGVAGAVLQVNSNQADQGRLGFVLAKPAGATFGGGSSLLVQVRFTASGATGSTFLSLGDLPVAREIASVTAEVRSADYLGGNVRVILPARLSAQVSRVDGRAELSLSGQAGETYQIEVSTDLVHWDLLSAQPVSSGPVIIDDPAASQFRQRFYRAVPQP